MLAQIAPSGQSLQDLQNMQRMQQMQQQMTSMPQQNGGFGYPQNGIVPQPTGYNSMSQMPQQPGFAPFQQPQPTGYQQPMQTGFQQPMQTGFQPNFQSNGSPFADPPRAPFQPMQTQPTGYNSFQPSPLNPQATGVNRFLPPAIQPQLTGFGQSAPPMPPMPPMPSMATAQPLVPQRTGPAPKIAFGVQAAKKLTPQPTGRANLANASKFNTFDVRMLYWLRYSSAKSFWLLSVECWFVRKHNPIIHNFPHCLYMACI
jgi:hypothetical protein